MESDEEFYSWIARLQQTEEESPTSSSTVTHRSSPPYPPSLTTPTSDATYTAEAHQTNPKFTYGK
jgi:hypothetical protein